MLELYMKENCPYCNKVIKYLTENNIKYISLDITKKKSNLKNLLRYGGKDQVPFLADDENNIYLYESDDIISYLKNGR